MRLSIGDIIRAETSDFIYKATGINVWKCTPTEKEYIRPLLAWYGDVKRKQTNGMHFIDQLDDITKQSMDRNIDYVVVTDIRFDEFEFDETDWIKYNNGILVHLQRKLPDGSILQPPNELERVNDPKLRDRADYKITWNTFLDSGHFKDDVDNTIKLSGLLLQKQTQTHHN